MKTKMKTKMSVMATMMIASGASAGPTFYAVSSSETTTTLHGGDRELTAMGFAGNSDAWTGANFLNWKDGRLTNNAGTYGWNDPVERDVNSANTYSGNPDRADRATPFVGEPDKTGTLAEVFGPFGAGGYKNMSYLIDGEDSAAWTLDLFFAAGSWLNADEDASTVEVAILERGGNSDLRMYGIRGDGSLTEGVMLSRGATGQAGWQLDSLEIGGSQNVHGLGVSLDSMWQGLAGLRFEAARGMNGPDLIAVGTIAPVPAPGAAGLMALGAMGLLRRRR